MGIELEILIVLSCGCGGLLCGWLLRDPTFSSAAGQQASIDNENQVKEVAAKLRQMSLRVAADVDAHQTKIQEVSNTLCESQDEEQPNAIFDAVAGLVEANQQMQRQLGDAQSQIRDQAQAIQSAEEMALTDGLTGISNRRAFDIHMEQRASLEANDHSTTLMIMDIDHFKKFNDNYGHQMGDAVLKLVASHLDAGFVDIGKVARYGGEEFAIIFDDLPIDEVKAKADKVREGIGTRDFIVDEQRLKITGSAGLAQLRSNEDVATWLERADRALYTAKEAGRNVTYWMDGDQAMPVVERPLEAEETEEVEQDEEAEDQSKLDIHTLDTLCSTASTTLSKLQAERIPFCLLAVKVDKAKLDEDELRVMLASVQASIRGIDTDRVAFDEESTFVVCLPSADESIAESRADAIIEGIRESYSEGSALRVQVGITSALATESFDDLLHRTLADVSVKEFRSIAHL